MGWLLSGRRLGLWFVVLLLAAWELSARTGLVSSPNWPPVSAVFAALGREIGDGTLLPAMLGTLYRMAVGFSVGSIAGILLGLLMGANQWVRWMLEPTLEFLRPLPVPALVPPLILFLGLDDPMKISIVAFTAMFPVLINTLEGAISIEPTYRAVAATFGIPWLGTLCRVLFPAALPYVFAGLRISLGLSFVVAVAGEMIAGSSGVGYYLVSMQYAGRAADMCGALLLLGLCGYAVNWSFLCIDHRVLHWHARSFSE